MDDTTGSEPTTPSAALLAALGTEHFALQSAASSTIGESGGRASIYLAAVSGGLVAIGFAGSAPELLVAIASTVFPTLFTLGWFTIVRLVDTSVVNAVAQERIQRIREYYATLDPAGPSFFPPDAIGSRGSFGVRYRRGSVLFTTASMVTVVNSIVGGAGIAVILTSFTRLGIVGCVAAGAAFGGVALGASIRYQVRRFSPLLQRVEPQAHG
jgi:hypothetical protein